MSLIHQALKKLETQERGAPAEFTLRTPTGYHLKKALIFALPAAIIASALAFYSLRFPALLQKTRPAHHSVSTVKAPVAPAAPAPLTAESGNSKGISLYNGGLFEEALKEFSAAAALKPGDARIYNNRALTWLMLDNSVEAGKNLEKALSISPAYPEALNNYGALLEKKGEHKKAEKYFREAIKAEPLYIDARFNLAASLEKRGDYKGAMANYEEFLRLAPMDPAHGDIRDRVIRLRSVLIVKEAGE